MKKRILTAITIIAVVALSLFLAACDGEALFKVIADYNTEQGTVTITDADGKAKSEFVAGAQVVVKVEASEGYEIDRFIVNGVDAELNNGIYAFYASSNTLVQATFKKSDEDGPNPNPPDDDKTPEELFAAAFESVQTTFKASGSYTHREEGQDPHIYSITTVFGNGVVNIIERNSDTGEILHDDIYVDKDGYLAQPYHTIDNKIEYNYPDERELFEGYDNPFKKLAATDFAKTEIENVFELTAEDKLTATATAITGWNEGIASFTVTIGDGKVININITTKRVTVASTSYTSVYTFTISAWGTAEVDEETLTPYKTTEAHTALKNALKAAGEAQNYTLHVYEQEAGYDDVEYDVYVTETSIYDNCEGWQSGYVEMNLKPDDGGEMHVYPFRIGDEEDGPEKDGKVVIGDAVNYPTVMAMRASFDGFAPEIFQNDGDVYFLRDECINFTDDVLVRFADGADNIILYRDYALSVQITLKDGELYQVELYYYVYGAFVKRTVTYTEWDNTTMPITFDDYVKESVLDDYVGTYTDQIIVVHVTSEGITINSRPFEITDYSSTQQAFTGMYNGQECSIIYMSAKQLAVVIGDNSYIVTNIDIEEVTVPAEFNGVWTDGDNSITVAYNKVMFGTNMLKVLSYDEDEGLVALRGSVTYRMVVGELQGEPVLAVRTLTSNITSQSYTMTKMQDGFIIPETFVGTYENNGLVQYGVVVTLNGVTVKIDNDRYVATDVAIGNDALKGTVINCKVNGVDYVIAKQQYGDGINLAGGAFDVNLSKTEDEDPATPSAPEVDIPEAFYGDYMYLNMAEHEYYFLAIDEKGIFASIDMSNNEYAAEVLDINENNHTITVTINGKTFYLVGSADNTDDGKYNIITLKNDVEGEGAIEVELLRDGYDPDDGNDFDVPAYFVGVYEGTRSDGVKFVLTVTATGMTVQLDDAEPVKVVIKNYESNDKRTRFTVKISKIKYSYVTFIGNLSEQNEPIQKLFLSGDDANVTLLRVTETESNND